MANGLPLCPRPQNTTLADLSPAGKDQESLPVEGTQLPSRQLQDRGGPWGVLVSLDKWSEVSTVFYGKPMRKMKRHNRRGPAHRALRTVHPGRTTSTPGLQDSISGPQGHQHPGRGLSKRAFHPGRGQ